MSECVIVRCSVLHLLQCVAVRCSVSQFAKNWSKMGGDEPKACQSVWHRVAVYYSVLQRVAVYCSVLQFAKD